MGNNSSNTSSTLGSSDSLDASAGDAEAIGGSTALLVKYSEGKHSQHKSEVIKKFARVLNASGFKLPTDNSDAVVEALKKQIPDPRKSRFNSASAAQHALCAKLSKAINQEFGHIIDEKASPDAVCEQVAELVYSLGTGMHGEFLVVRNTLQKAMDNLNQLNDLVRSSYDNLVSRVLAGEDEALKAEIPHIRSFYEELNAMTKHQLVVMANALNQSLSPVDSDLVKLLESSADYKSIVHSIKKGPGSEEFGQKISYLLYGVSTSAQIAKVVEAALKEVGLSASAWKSAASVKDLREDIYKLLKGKMSSASREDLTKFFKAAEVLYKYMALRPEIGDQIKGGFGGCTVGGYKASKAHKAHKSHGAGKRGGSDTVGPLSTMHLDKRVKREKLVRKELNKTFGQMFDQYLGDMIFALNAIAKQIGKEIPINDDHLIHFWKSITPLKNITQRNLYYSLSGYFSDASSRRTREEYLGNLRVSHDAAGHLATHSQSVKDYRNAISAIIELIDTFTSAAAEKRSVLADESDKVAPVSALAAGGDDLELGGTEGGLGCSPSDMEVGGSDSLSGGHDELSGGASVAGYKVEGLGRATKSALTSFWESVNPFKSGGDSMAGGAPQVAQLVENFSTAISNFDFFYRVARLRKNLEKSSSELKYYNEGYDTMLGASIAFEINKEQQEFAEVTRAFEFKYAQAKAVVAAMPETTDAEKTDKKAAGEIVENYWNGESGDRSTGAGERTGAKHELEVLEKQKDARIGLYRAAESIDKYLRLFTDAVAANPESMHELEKILDGVTVISEWFTKRSGDTLATLFESFGDGSVKLADLKSQHYYDAVAKSTVVGDVTKDAKDMVESYKLATNTMASLAVLKNIISTFVSIGDKVGSRQLYDEMHLTPKQLHDSLTSYIVASAFESVSGSKVEPFGVVRRTGDAVLPLYNDMNAAEVLMKTVSNPNVSAADKTAARAKLDAMKNSTGVSKPTGFKMASVESNPNDRFAKTDKIFIHVLKAIVAKIFTAVGVFTVFERPSSSHNSLSPVRLILGGGESTPTVIPEAMELYVRLPLLAEFYRDLFAFSEWGTDDSRKLTMIPEIGGPFAGLVTLIFDTAKFVTPETSYSDSHVRGIINEVNHIYKTFSSHADVVGTVMAAFVAEVNRRYGLISKENWQAYNESRKLEYGVNSRTLGELEDTSDYSILPNESDDTARKLSPSDQFLGTTQLTASVKPKKLISETDYDLLSKFRNKIESKIKKLGPTDDVFSFDESIRQLSTEVKGVSSEADKYRVVFRAVQGMNNFTKVSDAKMIFFHETVVAGITTLTAVHSVLDIFWTKLTSMDVRQVDKATVGEKLNGGTVDTAVAKVNAKYINRVAADRDQFVNRKLVLKDLLELLYVTSVELDGLVEIKLESDTFMIDFGKLLDLVSKQFDYVKHVLESFRGNVDPKITDGYFASLNVLETTLLDRYVLNKTDDSGEESSRKGVEKFIEIINNTMKSVSSTLWATSKDSYPSVYKSLIVGQAKASIPGTSTPFAKLLSTLDAPVTTLTLAPYYKSKSEQFVSESLFGSFNALLARYLELFYDSATDKIYLPAIDAFANGAFSEAVMNPESKFTVNDEVNVDLTGTTLNSEAVVLRSLAKVMNKLITESTTAGAAGIVRKHLTTSLADVPLHMRESFKCNMPLFVKLLDSLTQRTELVKSFMRNTVTEGSKDSLQKLTEFCDTLVRACFALRSCCVTVLKEVGDSSHFGDLYTGFLQDYETMYHCAPFTPHSLVQKVFNQNEKLLFPNSSPGSSVFKFNNMVRSVLKPGAHVSMGDMPGMKHILDAHNGSVTEALRMDSAKFNDFLDINMCLTRYVTDLLSRRTLGGDAGFDTIKLVDDKQSFATRTSSTVNVVVGMVESNFQDDRKEDLLEAVNDVSSVPMNRETAGLLNLMDMNIVPINVHALQRELPLAPVYNYSYTFDRIMEDTFNKSADKQPVHEGDMLCDWFTIPYRKFETDDVIEFKYMVGGSLKVHLGKPKFLYDELASKALGIEKLNGVPSPAILKAQSLNRLNTKFVQNITWLINLQRVIRYKLRSDLVYIDRPVVHSHKVLNENITELEGDDKDLKYQSSNGKSGVDSTNYKWKSEEYEREFHGQNASKLEPVVEKW